MSERRREGVGGGECRGERKTNHLSRLIWSLWGGESCSLADVSLRYEDVLDQTVSKPDVFNRMQEMEGDDNFLPRPHIHAHISPLGGKRGGHRVSLAINPPSRLPTSDLSRQPPSVPEHDELWDSGGVTPSPGPPLLNPPRWVLHWVQDPVRPCFRPPKWVKVK